MMFRQYKFKFYLNARHGIYKNGVMGEIHPHTWEIVINVVKGRDETVKFHHLEHRVEEFLSAYQDKTLNDVPPFDMINPTLENICEYFKEELTKILNRNGWIFLQLSDEPAQIILGAGERDTFIGMRAVVAVNHVGHGVVFFGF